MRNKIYNYQRMKVAIFYAIMIYFNFQVAFRKNFFNQYTEIRTYSIKNKTFRVRIGMEACLCGITQ